MGRRAFTLVEILVVLAIVTVLMGLLLPTLGRARRAAQATRAVSDMRQLLMGYTAYHLDMKGGLLWGYTPATVNGVPVRVTDPVTGYTFGLPVADRYPWRIAPYVGQVWSVLHHHQADPPPRPQPGDPFDVALEKAYALSVSPSFGINSVFLGGHAGGVFRGFVGPTGDSPNTGQHVAFRASEIRTTHRQIVFTEVVARNVPFPSPDSGLHFVTPPRARGVRWTVDDTGVASPTTEMITGLPRGRYGKHVIVGFFDGHVERVNPTELLDMRLWAPRADGPDYDF